MKTHAIIPIFIPHADCPHDCVFCNQKAITARTAPPTLEDNRHNWSKMAGIFNKTDNSVDVLIKKLGDADTRPSGNQNVHTTKEKFLAHIHNAITKNQNINEKN